jgi:hypothetical protein
MAEIPPREAGRIVKIMSKLKGVGIRAKDAYAKKLDQGAEWVANRDWQNIRRQTGRGLVIGAGATLGATKLGAKGVKAGYKGIKRVVTTKNLTSFFLLCVFVHFIDLMMGFNRRANFTLMAFLYTFIWLWSFLGVFKEEGEVLNTRYMGLGLGLSLLGFLLPYFRNIFGSFLPAAVANGIMVFAPVWVIYIMYFAPAPSWVTRFGAVYLAFWIIIFSMNYMTKLDETAFGFETPVIDVIKPFTDVKNVVVKEAQRIKVEIIKAFSTVSKGVKQQYAYATGDYYTGKVDEKAKEKLGVYLENFKAVAPEFYADEPVSVYATLTAKTLDEPIERVSISCVEGLKDKEQMEADDVIPQEINNIQRYDERDIDCNFNAGRFKKGSHVITMFVDFNFKTMSYLKTYFVDRERSVTMKRAGKDILDVYGIRDKDPEAVYTAGPVEIGMDIRNPPIEINRMENEKLFTLGVSLTSQWDGEITAVEELTLILPRSVKLKDKKCSGSFEFESVKSNFNNVYRMKEPEMLGRIKTFKTIRCPLIVDASEYEDVLGETPISIQYFKVETRYDYRLEKATSVTIKEAKI